VGISLPLDLSQTMAQTCIYALKEIVNLHRLKNVTIFMCLIDASKASDRVTHKQVCSKLILYTTLYCPSVVLEKTQHAVTGKVAYNNAMINLPRGGSASQMFVSVGVITL